MYDKLKTAIKQVDIKQVIIGLLVLIFILSCIVGYFGSQEMYHEVIQQKILRDKSNKL